VAQHLNVAYFREECSLGDKLHDLMQLFTYSTVSGIATGSACNRFHSTESRMARWLMMVEDRLKTNAFHITQEFLSYMLGVRREAINKIPRDFGRRKSISYSRGNLSITYRKGLEGIVCKCYAPLWN